MSTVLWSIIGGVLGFMMGAAAGFTVALAWASVVPNPSDGTFAMRQMIVCLPLGALAGLMAGIAWGASGRT